jgi:hypothetical protein
MTFHKRLHIGPDGPPRRLNTYENELISCAFAEPSDGLEPSTSS